MTIEQLRYFVLTAQEISINAASKKLHISPQALSRTLINLENELQATLLERSRHGITLTPAGQRLLASAGAFLESLNYLDGACPSSAFFLDNPCTLLSSPGLEHFFPSFLALLYQACPGLQINIRYRTYQHILDEVEQRSVELALTNISSIGGQSIYPSLYDDLLFYPLFHYYYFCVASVKSPLATYKTVSVKTLLAYPLICVGEDLDHSAMSFIRKIGRPCQVIWEPHFKMAYPMTAANLGVMLGYAPEKSPLPLSQSAELIHIPLKENITSIFGYVLKKDAPLSRHTQELIRFLHSTTPPQTPAEPLNI